MDETTLLFESRFESGNLAKAIQVGKWDYELYLSFDLYTNKHTQWFYFSVRNMRKGQTYRFTIINLYKAGSLYNEGMQPVMYSVVGAKRSGVGWSRRGHNIKYFKTPVRRQDTKAEAYYFGLTWSHTFEYADDTCYFAHCYPYTYSDLQDYLSRIASDPVKSEYCKQRVLCHSIAGNPVPLLTITASTKSPDENQAKRAVVLTSRVHPGETNGSWMMKGLLDFLTGDSADAKTLRNNFVFKVVPMMNPDGVIVGNYRCSLAGRDLNRNYRTKLKDAYPTVWHTKAMVKRLKSERNIVLYCDLHGHSRKQNVFIYGCDNMDNELLRLRSRIFPKMLSKISSMMFSYKSSRFGVHKSKEGTGRVVMWREMGITNSYTMESTFCGSILGAMARLQFRSVDLEKMGYYLCDTILDYCDPDQSKVERVLQQLEDDYRASVLAHLASLGQAIPPGVDPLDIQLPTLGDIESSDAGSDSSESDGPPVHYMVKERKKKKKRLKSRRERNKRKAILKLSHFNTNNNNNKVTPPHPTSANQPVIHAPSSIHLPQPISALAHDDKRTISVSEITAVSSEVPKNNGIPIFVQERLDERQKKRGDNGSTVEMDHLDAVALDYLRQGIPPHLTDVDPRASMASLPRSSLVDCPINITPMALCEGGRGTRPPSRASSRTSLPQLIESRTHGAFTSQYLAHHLQDLMSGTGDTPSSPPHLPSTSSTALPASNSTRNLANLSRLFRQLRPQLVSAEKRSQKSLQGRVHPERDSVKNPSKAEFYSFKNISHSESSRHLGAKTKMTSSRHSVAKETMRSSTSKHQLLSSSSSGKVGVSQPEAPSQDHTQNSSSALPPAHTTPPPPITTATTITTTNSVDHRSTIEPQSSHSSLGRASSSLTNSWESFTAPMKLSGRASTQASVGNADVKPSEQPKPPMQKSSSLDSHLKNYRTERHKIVSTMPKLTPPAPNQQATPTAHTSNQLTPISEHTSLMKQQATPKTTPTNMSASVIEHKRQVSEAVNNIHMSKKPKSLKKKRLYREKVLDIEDDSTSHDNLERKKSSKKDHLVGIMDHIPFTAEPHPLITTADLIGSSKSNNTNTTTSNSTTNSNNTSVDVNRTLLRSARVSSALGAVMRGPGMVSTEQDEEHEYFSELTDNINRKEHYTVTAGIRMYSSKPPSRSGARTSTDHHKAMASVNVALSSSVGGTDQPRPSTHYRFRKPRPLLFRSHSRTSGSFSDL